MELPKPMPAASAWSTKRFEAHFFLGYSLHGVVAGTIGESTTPARSTSWGAIKNLYHQ
jgi:hypothetical protein